LEWLAAGQGLKLTLRMSYELRSIPNINQYQLDVDLLLLDKLSNISHLHPSSCSESNVFVLWSFPLLALLVEIFAWCRLSTVLFHEVVLMYNFPLIVLCLYNGLIHPLCIFTAVHIYCGTYLLRNIFTAVHIYCGTFKILRCIFTGEHINCLPILVYCLCLLVYSC